MTLNVLACLPVLALGFLAGGSSLRTPGVRTGSGAEASPPVLPIAAGGQERRGQLGSEPAWFRVSVKERGEPVEYLGQATSDGLLVLTASNGFFDHGIRAKGESDSKDVANGKKERGTLIAHDYARLTGWRKPTQTLRWHFWAERPGLVEVTPHLELGQGHADAVLELTLGGQTQQVSVGDLMAGQGGVGFELQGAGKHTLMMRLALPPSGAACALREVELQGTAIEGAKLLRARWRPGAVHGGYRASTLESTDMWVMASRSVPGFSSYSPITTPFGYFGVSFGADGRGGPGCNFSMWSKGDLPLERQPHLLALGSPKAEFSGFGHEGIGVKPRDWDPFSHRPEEIVLGLRRERDGEFDTYYGYFLGADGNWTLYAAGRKWRSKAKAMWPGSFVEVPGPPDRQRSGDQVRKVLRKGWVRDVDGGWHRLDILKAGKSTNANKAWGTNAAGWFTFEMGGMEHFSSPKREITLDDEHRGEGLPRYLVKGQVEGLFQLPAEFGAITAMAQGTAAELEIELLEVGAGASAVVFFGKIDCLTFAPRDLHGTERRATALQEGGTWSRAASMPLVSPGSNKVTLDGLEPGATYYFRILVQSERGRMWTFKTHSFEVPAR